MKKVEILKSRNYRGGLGPRGSGEIVEIEDSFADQLVEQGCAKFASSFTSCEPDSKLKGAKKDTPKKIKEG